MDGLCRAVMIFQCLTSWLGEKHSKKWLGRWTRGADTKNVCDRIHSNQSSFAFARYVCVDGCAVQLRSVSILRSKSIAAAQ